MHDHLQSLRKSFDQPADDEEENYGDEDNYDIRKDPGDQEDFESSPATKYTEVNDSIMHTEAKLSGDQQISEKMHQAERRI
jgi:hypothetical protein